MKKKIFTALLLLCVLLVAAEAQETKKSSTVEVSNTWNKAKADEPVVIKLSEINPQFRVRSAVVMNGNEEIPSQLVPGMVTDCTGTCFPFLSLTSISAYTRAG